MPSSFLYLNAHADMSIVGESEGSICSDGGIGETVHYVIGLQTNAQLAVHDFVAVSSETTQQRLRVPQCIPHKIVSALTDGCIEKPRHIRRVIQESPLRSDRDRT